MAEISDELQQRLKSLGYDPDEDGMEECLGKLFSAVDFSKKTVKGILGVDWKTIEFWANKCGLKVPGKDPNPGKKVKGKLSEGIIAKLKAIGYEEEDPLDAMEKFLRNNTKAPHKKLKCGQSTISWWRSKLINKIDPSRAPRKKERKKRKYTKRMTSKTKVVEGNVADTAYEDGREVAKSLIGVASAMKENFLKGLIKELKQSLKE